MTPLMGHLGSNVKGQQEDRPAHGWRTTSWQSGRIKSCLGY